MSKTSIDVNVTGKTKGWPLIVTGEVSTRDALTDTVQLSSSRCTGETNELRNTTLHSSLLKNEKQILMH